MYAVLNKSPTMMYLATTTATTKGGGGVGGGLARQKKKGGGEGWWRGEIKLVHLRIYTRVEMQGPLGYDTKHRCLKLVEVLLYVHRNRRSIRDRSPGRPPRLSQFFYHFAKYL